MPSPTATRWVLTHRYTLAVAVTLTAMAIPFFFANKKSEWKAVFVAAGAKLAAGEDFYVVETGYTYPPFQALLGLPCVGLPKVPATLLWYAANAVALVWLLRAAWRLTGGGRLDGEPPAGWREGAVCVLGLLVGGCFCFHAVAHQQTDLLVSALVVGGCDLLARNRSKSAGVLIGLAAAMKCTPLLFAPYLILKRRFAAAACLVAVAAGVNLLPDLVSRPPAGGTWLGHWFSLFLAPMAQPDYAPGVWASDVLYNQSLVGAAGRWTRTTWDVVNSKVVTRDVPPVLDPVAVKRFTLLFAVGLCGLAVLTGIRRRDYLFQPPESPPRIALECGLVLSLMLLLSPMSSLPHFIPLLVPGFALARLAVVGRDRVAAVFLALMILAAMSSNKDLLGPKLYTLGLWYGGVTVLAAAAYAGGLWSLVRPNQPITSRQEVPTVTRRAA
jgi:Glycosyltransferase family 87